MGVVRACLLTLLALRMVLHSAFSHLTLRAGGSGAQVDGMTALTLAKRQSKLEGVALLEENADDRKKRAQEAKYGVWSGRLGQAD